MEHIKYNSIVYILQDHANQIKLATIIHLVHIDKGTFGNIVYDILH